MSTAPAPTMRKVLASNLRHVGRQVLHWIDPAPPPPPTPTQQATYRELCVEAFGKDVSLGANYLFWTLPFGSSEMVQLYQAMMTIEFSLFSRWLQIVRDENIPGAIVEFGVWQGNGLRQIIERCEALGLRRPTFGFDSFEGLPEPSPDDLQCFKAGEYASRFEEVSARLEVSRRTHVQLVKGWFCDSLARPEIVAHPDLQQIAVARIDGDLYQSTVDCLKFVENRLAHGSYLWFDDWAHRTELGETKAFFEFYERVKHIYRFEHVAALGQGSLHLRVWRR